MLQHHHMPDTPPSSMEESGSRYRHCLVCGVQTANSHMGIDSCRACAVFYKRTLTGTRPLKCKLGGGNCLLSDPTTSCRKCRFERFASIMHRAYGTTRRPQMEVVQQQDFPMSEEPEEQFEEPESIGEESEDVKDVKLIMMPSTSFIDHTKYFELETASGTPLLDRIRRGYSLFCMMRKLGETSQQFTCHKKDICFDRDLMKFIPATYSNTLKYGRVYVESLFDFAHSAFDDYKTLSQDEKKIFMRNSFGLVGAVTGAYRALHHFPHDETVFVSYTTTLTYESAASFFDDAPSESNKDDATRAIRENLHKGNRLKKDNFRRVMPNEDEFMALLGLAFWNTEQDIPSENLTRIATRNREIIMREMHQSYWREGRTDYAVRIGELFCLLVTIQKSVSMMAEEIQLYRLLDVFDESIFKKCEGERS
ncbi:hypothetical protein PMAYCL1PPCAC_17244 [Pristionchus mayeri]|uniref:Nuclear receptor n=1 Tax=Pristionchus mayeri TaxID=1317129 RepID=A0AAN5CMH9_9BILA|nr:hypothetical protein PMAYCL1PPCAC_17244 [Pristionchus mayeri]